MSGNVRITVDVTAEHIQCGRPRQSRCCPIAHALSGLVRGRVGVTPPIITMVDHVPPYIVRLPWQAAEFVREYDRGGAVDPFAFDLDVPADCIAPGVPETPYAGVKEPTPRPTPIKPGHPSTAAPPPRK